MPDIENTIIPALTPAPQPVAENAPDSLGSVIFDKPITLEKQVVVEKKVLAGYTIHEVRDCIEQRFLSVNITAGGKRDWLTLYSGDDYVENFNWTQDELEKRITERLTEGHI